MDMGDKGEGGTNEGQILGGVGMGSGKIGRREGEEYKVGRGGGAQSTHYVKGYYICKK